MNTDYLLTSTNDLAALPAALDSHVELLHCERDEDGKWYATIEAADSGEEHRTPTQDIESILAALDAIDPAIAELIAGCESKEMNIGWQASSDRPEGTFALQPRLLGELAARGIELAVTIYPSSENLDEDE